MTFAPKHHGAAPVLKTYFTVLQAKSKQVSRSASFTAFHTFIGWCVVSVHTIPDGFLWWRKNLSGVV